MRNLDHQNLMNVLFITSWYPTKENSISGIFVKRYVDCMKKFCNVNVFHPVPVIDLEQKNISEIKSYDNVNVYTFYYRVNSANSFYEKLLNIIIEYKTQYFGFKKALEKFGNPDLVHVQVIYPFGWLALFLFYTKNIPYIITEHWTGYTKKSNTYEGKRRKFLTKKIAKHASCITTVSESLCKAMKYHGLKNNYYVIPNVVNTNPKKTPKPNKTKIEILTVGNLKNEHKNVEGIIKTLKTISKIRNDFHLTIIGDGKDRKFLETLVKSLSISSLVTFTGQISDNELENYCNRSDFFVMNSNYETFSVVTAEAIGYGLPVIVTRCGGPEEFVNKEVGIVIEPNNPKQLEEAILNMLQNFQKYDIDQLSNYSNSLFSSEIIGKKFFNLYKKIVML